MTLNLITYKEHGQLLMVVLLQYFLIQLVISGTVSLVSTGGDTYKPTFSTEATAFNDSVNGTHTTATVCLDLSSASTYNLRFKAQLAGFYTNTSWLRVRVGSNVLQDVNGNTAYVGPNSAVLSYLYDLSAYSGQSAYI